MWQLAQLLFPPYERNQNPAMLPGHPRLLHRVNSPPEIGTKPPRIAQSPPFGSSSNSPVSLPALVGVDPLLNMAWSSADEALFGACDGRIFPLPLVAAIPRGRLLRSLSKFPVAASARRCACPPRPAALRLQGLLCRRWSTAIATGRRPNDRRGR